MTPENAARFESLIEAAMASCDFPTAERLVADYQNSAESVDERDPARSPAFRVRYLAARVALVSGHLERALALANSLTSWEERLPRGVNVRLLLLIAEAHASRGCYTQARDYLKRAESFGTEGDPLIGLHILRIRLRLGDIRQLGTVLASCHQQLCNDPVNRALLFIEQARAWEKEGDLDRAEETIRRAVELVHPLNASPVRASTYTQVGRFKHLRGKLQAAIDAYDTALESSIAGTPQVKEIQLRRLLVELELNRWNQGHATFSQITRSLGSKEIPEELRRLFSIVSGLLSGQPDNVLSPNPPPEVEAYHHAVRGERHLAFALYRRAFDEASGPVRQARIAMMLGILATEDGDHKEAERWLMLAERWARQHDLPEILWRTLKERASIASEFGKDDQLARQLFEEAFFVSEQQRPQNPAYAAAYDLHRKKLLRYLLRGALRRQDADAVFYYQELDRGRLLWELWHSAGFGESNERGEWVEKLHKVDEQIHQIETSRVKVDEGAPRYRHELLLQRDRILEELLTCVHGRDRVVPPVSQLSNLKSVLPRNSAYLSPILFDDELHCLVVQSDDAVRMFRVPTSLGIVKRQLDDFKGCVEQQLSRYAEGLAVPTKEREELDAILTDLGCGPIGQLLWQAIEGVNKRRLLWVPDAELYGLPIHAFRRNDRYLVETHEIAYSFHGSQLCSREAYQVSGRRGLSLVVTESSDSLPCAALEARGVAASFLRSRILHGTSAAHHRLHDYLRRASILHVACHAYFDVEHPLNAFVLLPTEDRWYAVDWPREPMRDLNLLTLSACRSAEVSAFAGNEVFGLVTGALAAGVHNVVAGLWSVPDTETTALMWRFYRHLIRRDAITALCLAQRETLAEGCSTPLSWAVFAVFLGQFPKPRSKCWLADYWSRYRQWRHAKQFPTPCLAQPNRD